MSEADSGLRSRVHGRGACHGAAAKCVCRQASCLARGGAPMAARACVRERNDGGTLDTAPREADLVCRNAFLHRLLWPSPFFRSGVRAHAGDPNCLHIPGLEVRNGSTYTLVVSDKDDLDAVLPATVVTSLQARARAPGRLPPHLAGGVRVCRSVRGDPECEKALLMYSETAHRGGTPAPCRLRLHPAAVDSGSTVPPSLARRAALSRHAAVCRSGSACRRCGKWLCAALRAKSWSTPVSLTWSGSKVSIIRADTAVQSRQCSKASAGSERGAVAAPRAGDADLHAEPAAAGAGVPAPAPGPDRRAGRRLHRHQGAELCAAARGGRRRVQPVQAHGAAGRPGRAPADAAVRGGRRRRACAVAAGGQGARLARILHAVGAPAWAPAAGLGRAPRRRARRLGAACWSAPILMDGVGCTDRAHAASAAAMSLESAVHCDVTHHHQGYLPWDEQGCRGTRAGRLAACVALSRDRCQAAGMEFSEAGRASVSGNRANKCQHASCVLVVTRSAVLPVLAFLGDTACM